MRAIINEVQAENGEGTMRVGVLVLIAASIVCTSECARADDTAPPRTGDGGHRHEGFFIRPDFGYGYISSSGGEVTIARAAVLGTLHVGGSLAENLILGAAVYAGGTGKSGSVLISGEAPPLSESATVLAGIGPELTYYLMPVNVYVSTTVGFTSLTVIPLGQSSGSGHGGFGGRVGVGKEWWVSQHWGLGLVGHASESWNSVDGVSYSTWSLGAAFSATYN
jgi:hypothetical protein